MAFETTNSIRAEADAGGRQLPPAGRRLRVGEVQHDAGLRLRHMADVEVLDLEFGLALVDEAGVALPLQEIVTSCSEWRRWVASPQPTMAGTPSSRETMAACEVRPPWSVTMALAFFMIGHPVGVGRAGDEHRTLHEPVDVTHVLD